VRGEIVLVVDGGAALAPAAHANGTVDDQIDALLASGASTAAIAKRLAADGAGERRALYARIGARRSGGTAAPDEGSTR
jgi:hypothetical protein